MKPNTFETEHMAGGARVLHRSLRRSRLMAVGMLCLAVFNLAMTAITLIGPAPLFVTITMVGSTAVFVACALLLSVIRVSVTSDELHVQFGLWGPRVPIAAVQSCRVVAYDWKKFGGWGIKRAWDGTWAYTLSPSDDVVELRWTADGKEKKAVFNAADPVAVADAVQRARGQHGARRIDAAPEAHEDFAEREDRINRRHVPASESRSEAEGERT